MSKKISKKALSLVIAALMLIVATVALSGTIASAETSGDYTYTVKDGKATITGYSGSSTSVSIPSSIGSYKVTTIGKNAFNGNSTLVSVSIPATVTTIADAYYSDEGAFHNCSKLQSVTFAKGSADAYIGERSFQNCTALTSIEIPGNYATIGSSAFADCKNLLSFTYNKSSYTYANQKINSYAFSGCSALETVSLPTTLKTISNHAFQGTSIVDLVIPEGVTSIGKASFRNCSYLTSASIPSTVTEIVSAYYNDEGAFQNCTRLQSVTFAEGTTDAYIGERTFQNCTSLAAIVIPGNYATISSSAFEGCKNLKSLTYNKSSYTYANQKINSYAFYGCSSLETVSLPTTLKTISNHAFQGTSIVDLVIPEGVTSIGKASFRNCDYLTSVSIPSTVTEIVSAYYNDEGAFQNCKRLQSVTIKEGSKDAYIGERAFQGCTSLPSVTIPGNYTTIGSSAFEGCSKLETLIYQKSSYIYANQTINSYAFYGCSSLENVSLSTTLKTISNFTFQGTSIVNLVIPEGVTGIGKGAFKNCSNLASVSIPSTVTSITGAYYSDEGAFHNCTSLKMVIFAEGDKDLSIGERTFNGCKSLTTVHLPQNFVSAGKNVFDGSKTNLTICAKSMDSYAKTYADNNGIPFVLCSGAHELPDVPDIPDTPVVTTYTLSYNANGGSGAPAAQTGASTYTISTTVPVRSGYKFLGWAFDKSAASASCTGGANITLTSDTVLYAVWQKVETPPVVTTYTLSYDANGGSGAPAAQTGASTYTISTTVPVRSGYKFLGWAFDKNATSASCTGGANITISSDTVLYAVWQKVETPPVVTAYTLSYNANGGSGAPAAQTGSVTYTISSTVPVRSGYKFLGWATSASATSATYTAGKTITLTKNTVLYAVWQVAATEPAKFVCPYCGEKFGAEDKYEDHVEEEIVSRNIAVVFRNPSTTLINYGDSIILHVDTYNLPEGSTIKWSVSNGNFAIVSYSVDRESCTITPNNTGDTVITATVYDAEGKEICSDSQMMSAKAGIWQKIVAFFKKLFGLTKTIPEAIKSVF